MPTELRNLRIGEVSLVDKGAGKGVRITLTKRREPQETQKNMTLEEALKLCPPEVAKVIMEALEAARKPAEPMKSDSPPAGVSPDVAKAWPSLSAEIRKVFVDQAAAAKLEVEKAQAESIAKQKALETEVQKLKDADERRTFVAKAAELKHIPALSQDELADVLHAVAKGRAIPEATAKKFEAALKGVDEAIKQSALLKERGSDGRGGEGSAEAKLESIAKSFREKDPTLTHAAAQAKAYREHPDLYAQHQKEAGAARAA